MNKCFQTIITLRTLKKLDPLLMHNSIKLLLSGVDKTFSKIERLSKHSCGVLRSIFRSSTMCLNCSSCFCLNVWVNRTCNWFFDWIQVWKCLKNIFTSRSFFSITILAEGFAEMKLGFFCSFCCCCCCQQDRLMNTSSQIKTSFFVFLPHSLCGGKNVRYVQVVDEKKLIMQVVF